MVDVLLTHSFSLRYDEKQRRRMQPYPPLALLYAASLIRSAGYTIAFFDSTFADPRSDFARVVEELKPRFVAIFEDSFNFVTKMCLGRMRETALGIAESAAAAGAAVISAGPDVTDNPEVYLDRGVDYALAGEAELSLLDLLDVLTGRSSLPLAEVEGVWRRTEDGALAGRRRAPERTPDRFPFPAWDLIDVEAYRAAWREAHGYFSVNMATTRGCPYQCNWCAKPIWGNQYASRSPANVAEEMAHVKHTVEPDHVWFSDDIFGLRPAWVEQFAVEVEARRCAIPFMIQTRVDRMTPATVAALKRAGCEEIWMGAESGSQRILDAMEKGTDVRDVTRAVETLREAGVRSGLFLQFGYPGETMEEIMATVRMVRECVPDKIGISVSYPLPGTRFYDRVWESLGPQARWRDSGDLAMMFSGPYTSPFYRKLHEVVHLDLHVRQKARAVVPQDGLAADLDALCDAWFELGRMEPTHKNANPTQLAVVWDGASVPTARQGTLR